ncbi:ribonuclease P protein component [Flavobacterium selenitireducens]|uniref:ribonuclease P protein component n=1 Tax=Flavobacterium selenitireducens TaxID=2722704 RepID=UPI00168B6A57|nr:ribonuclease P protein component [Flavobacterium selenitireducens]MBD3583739.1 ribonuclease P protein component [Flavobacterium selenitireducens]
MALTYPKSEKLKSRKTIERLFTEGKSVSKYPLRLVYIENISETGLIQMGVSVSKRNFKKAHDRNYFKRCLREAYRLNKHILLANLETPHAFMLLYQSSERLTSNQIQTKTIALFEKFNVREIPKPE